MFCNHGLQPASRTMEYIEVQKQCRCSIRTISNQVAVKGDALMIKKVQFLILEYMQPVESSWPEWHFAGPWRSLIELTQAVQV